MKAGGFRIDGEKWFLFGGFQEPMREIVVLQELDALRGRWRSHRGESSRFRGTLGKGNP
jgi:hypothetical protein